MKTLRVMKTGGMKTLRSMAKGGMKTTRFMTTGDARFSTTNLNSDGGVS